MTINLACSERGHVYCLGIVCLDPDDECKDEPVTAGAMTTRQRQRIS